MSRVLVGTSDPLSGLVAVTRSALAESRGGFSAVGRSFTMELVTKVADRQVEVPIRSVPAWRWPHLGWDDVRHAKRLADHRYGTLSRLFQFCTVGASGMILDLTFYALLLKVLGGTTLATQFVPLTKIPASRAVARLIAIFVALCWNFSLNRRLTFSDTRGYSSLLRQFLTYALGNCLSILVSLGLSLGLPRWVPAFKYHELTAAVIGIVVGTAISFSMARWVVFRKARAHLPTATATPQVIAPVQSPDDGLATVRSS
jgi:dolichol-phosphate mannosyltransferase